MGEYFWVGVGVGGWRVGQISMDGCFCGLMS